MRTGRRAAGRESLHPGRWRYELRGAGKSGQRLQHAVSLSEGQLRRHEKVKEVLGLSDQQRGAASIEKRHALLIALAQGVWKTTPIDV